MAARVCSRPGCPTLTAPGARGGRCSTHQREADKARGTRAERGYGPDFEQLKQDPEYVNANLCETCGVEFTEDNPKTAGHRQSVRAGGDFTSGIKPECRRCNYGWRRTGS